MGIVKAISGHTGARGVMRYLERDGRALARGFLNIGAPIEGWEGDLPRYGACDWAAEMDSVREAAGNGRAWRGRAARTWKHYVLSPDPGSRVDLSTLRGLAVEWASEHFPDHQVAIVYHDDNEGRIPHAHVVVNNTSLETGRRLQVPDPLELNRSFQRLEAERSLPHLSNEPLARPTARARRSRGERAAEARGERSWLSSAEAVIRDGRAAWWRLGDGFVDDRLLEAAGRKWLEHGGGSAIGRVLKVDALLERANPSASLEERCAAMGMTPEMRDAAALAAEALGEEDYKNLA